MIGFMQGRLSPKIGNLIQAFPKETWRTEFKLGHQLGFQAMEWTLDHEGLDQNPFMHPDGQAEILRLKQEFQMEIPSVTCDCFMQAPFFKATGNDGTMYFDELLRVVDSSVKLGLSIVVLPLVDNGRIENTTQNTVLKEGLAKLGTRLEGTKVQIAFETDLPPQRLKDWLADLDPKFFGVNYDMGNSASLGFDPLEELSTIGDRVFNVHVKDRLLGGTTVPLGRGNTDFTAVFKELRRRGYARNYILQTARADDGDHAGVLRQYRRMVEDWINGFGTRA